MPRYLEDSPEFTLIPEGPHPVTLKMIKDKETSTGKPQWLWVFELEDLTKEDGEPAVLFEKTFCNQSHMNNIFDPDRQWLDERINEAKAAGDSFDVESLIGEAFTAYVGTREWNGRTFNTIQKLLPISPDFGDPFAEDSKDPAATGSDPFKGN